MTTILSLLCVRRVVPWFMPTTRALSTTSVVANMNKHSPNYFLHPSLLNRYRTLQFEGCKVNATYVWVDGTGEQLRSKCRVFDFLPRKLSDIPVWTFNGMFTAQGADNCCELYLNPVQFYSDPFNPGYHKIILCESYDIQKNPTPQNHRVAAVEAAETAHDQVLQFGFEQQFTFVDMDGRPWGWPRYGYVAPEGPYYAGVGGSKVFGRSIIDAHKYCCLHAGLYYGGNNAEVFPSQWEYQTFHTDPIRAADDLWMSRYILERVAEDFGVSISYHPKLLEHWNGCGLNANFSSEKMRMPDTGIEETFAVVEKLKARHMEHMKVYDPKGGEYNKLRMSGSHDTEHFDVFSSGVGDYCKSVRIPLQVKEACYGYIEDRRPASNADPYQVLEAIIRTCFC